MDTDDDVDVIFSELCADVEIDGRFLTVEIYKTTIDPSWYLEVINEFGTTTLYDEPFLADGLAWQQFEKTVKEKGLGSVDVHLSQSIVAAIEMKAEKLVSVLQ
jgi:hypothetical protein